MNARHAGGEGKDPAARLGVGDLRGMIARLHARLDEIGDPPSPLDVVVDSTNTLRTNEYLAARDAVSSRLISYYAQYADALTSLADSMLDVQSDLVDVLREQSAMLEGKGGARRRSGATTPTAASAPGRGGAGRVKRGTSARRQAKRAPKDAQTSAQ